MRYNRVISSKSRMHFPSGVSPLCSHLQGSSPSLSAKQSPWIAVDMEEVTEVVAVSTRCESLCFVHHLVNGLCVKHMHWLSQ